MEYHPFLEQGALLAQARAMGHMLTAYSPIAKGRVAQNPTLREIGAAHSKSAVQVTLRWLLQQELVAAIPKSASAERQAANFDIFDFELSAEEMAAIDRLGDGGRLVDPAPGRPTGTSRHYPASGSQVQAPASIPPHSRPGRARLKPWNPVTATHPPQASRTSRKPICPVELSGVLEVRAATR